MFKKSTFSRLIRFTFILLSLILWIGLSSAQEHGSASISESTQSGAASEHTATIDESHAGAAESAHGAEAEKTEGEGGILGLLQHHLMDSSYYQFFGLNIALPVIHLGNFQLPVTKHTLMLITVAFFLMILLLPLRRVGSGIPHGLSNFFEVLIVFIRDEVVYPSLGEKEGRKYLPFFLTFFFFVLFSNLLGMIPYGSSSTGNISVTGALAATSLLVMIGSGIVRHGPLGYMGSFVPHGVPAFVIPILFPIEIAGLLVKHFALCIRLFANMLAGHAVITVFLGLISSYFVAPVAILGAVAISMLELFVAVLQAYIFTMLSSLFIGSAIHGGH
ncbi:MAG: F0F1 ATP synthase subunit A [bacterium]|nr:F0F1 ATP synthase subunit A [bacterium]